MLISNTFSTWDPSCGQRNSHGSSKTRSSIVWASMQLSPWNLMPLCDLGKMLKSLSFLHSKVVNIYHPPHFSIELWYVWICMINIPFEVHNYPFVGHGASWTLHKLIHHRWRDSSENKLSIGLGSTMYYRDKIIYTYKLSTIKYLLTFSLSQWMGLRQHYEAQAMLGPNISFENWVTSKMWRFSLIRMLCEVPSNL